MIKQEAFERLKYDLLSCRSCKDIFAHEPKPIFQGVQKSKIMQISQAPSRKVMLEGKPFYDESGKRLKQEWYQISDEQFYDPHNFYIASMAHCYPGKGKHSGDAKPPEKCAHMWLMREIELVDNEVYIIIGGIAAAHMFPKQNLEELIFHDQVLYGKPAFVLPHPSPLNRRWWKTHPSFEQERMPYIRSILHHFLFKI